MYNFCHVAEGEPISNLQIKGHLNTTFAQRGEGDNEKTIISEQKQAIISGVGVGPTPEITQNNVAIFST